MIQVRQAGLADRDQVALLGHGLDVAGAFSEVERGDAEVAAVADLAGGDGIDEFHWKIGQELRGRDEYFLDAAVGGQGRYFIEGSRGFDLEIARCGATQSF